LIQALANLGDFGLFVAQFLRSSLTHPLPVSRTLEEAYRIGVQSLPILLIVSVFVGTNLAVQGHNAFEQLGGQAMVGTFVALAGVREMAPIMVASMIAAKAGTEMASQIAVMRIQEQIDALEVMAIDPHWFLVTPRLLGILLVLPGLTMISIATLLVSAWAVAVWQLGLNGADFLAQCADITRGIDLVFGAIKAFVFAIIICLVSCYYGFTSPRGPAGVGKATNSAVVVSAVVCALLNYVLSELLYG
jgi:phospholipid/cholesterol/gamma-HCH transport system permease protein